MSWQINPLPSCFHILSSSPFLHIPRICLFFCLPSGGLFDMFFSRGVQKTCLKQPLASSYLSVSVRPSAWNNSAPTGRIFMKFSIWIFFENMTRTFKLHYNLTRIISSLHEYLCTIISRSFILRMRNITDESFRENKDIHFMFNNFLNKSHRLQYNVENMVNQSGYRWQYNTAHAPCVLDY